MILSYDREFFNDYVHVRDYDLEDFTDLASGFSSRSQFANKARTAYDGMRERFPAEFEELFPRKTGN